ncbi:unnamed protein product [Auanema sp. JU1783]|nr:unnamed protein product [Auanema sp. JU1783]
MRKGGAKRKREEDEGDVSMQGEDEDSRSGVAVKVEPPKGKEKDPEFSAPKGQKLTDLDEENLATNGPPKEIEGNAIEQTHYIVVPSYSAWFDYNTVHQIERRACPEFFNGRNKSKTPEVYLAYRNFMIDTYRLNPFEYLSATACRRNLAGDVCSIVRLHAFLEQWGLINYQVDNDSRPAPVAPPPTSHFMVLADTPSGVQPINPNPSNYAPEKKAEPVEDGEKAKVEQLSNVGLRTDQYQKMLAAMKAKGAAPGRDWTDQETLLLLEGLEMFKDDWNKVSDHVGTRTQDECILRFLQLPIQDPYLSGEEGVGATDVLGPLAYQPIPFSQSGNPVMSTVAFLASVVDPKVAAAASKAAIEEFSKIKDEVPPLVLEAHARNVQAHEEKTGVVDGTVGLAKSGIAIEEKKEDTEGEKMDTTEPVEKKVNDVELEETAKKAVSEKVQEAAASALAAAAVKAKHLSTIEERRIKTLVAQLVETQMKKLEMKLKHFDELEQIMDKEREALEYQRQQLILERQAFHQDQLRYLEQRAKHEAHNKLVSAGQLPHGLPPGFEVSGPPQPTPQVQVAIPPSQDNPKQIVEKIDSAEVTPAPQPSQPTPTTTLHSAPAPAPPTPATTAAPPQPPVQVPPQSQPAPPHAAPVPGPTSQQNPGYAPQQHAPGHYPPHTQPGFPPQGYPGPGQYYGGHPGGYPPQQQPGYYNQGRPYQQPPAPGYQRPPYQGQPPYQGPPRPGPYSSGSYPQQGHGGYAPPQGYGQGPPAHYPPPGGAPPGAPGGPPGAPGQPQMPSQQASLPPVSEAADAATPPMHQGEKTE